MKKTGLIMSAAIVAALLLGIIVFLLSWFTVVV